MKKIVIMSDSTCDLSKELIEKYGIKVFPLHINMGENQYLDGINIKLEDLYQWSDETGKIPKTSALSPLEAEDYITDALKEGEYVICFTISQKLSSTYNVMNLAVRSLEVEDRVHIIDSMNLSTGIGLQMLEAVRLANENKDFEEIIKTIEGLQTNINASFVVDTLTYLHRGGRCPGIASLAGNSLKIHPCIHVKNGQMEVGKFYRGKMNRVIRHYVEDMKKSLKNADKNIIFITHSGCQKDIIDEVYKYLLELGFKNIYITQAGSVIASHCGPGTLGVLYIENKEN